jgi:hypothetical protein
MRLPNSLLEQTGQTLETGRNYRFGRRVGREDLSLLRRYIHTWS